jgi:hypothetical protein
MAAFPPSETMLTPRTLDTRSSMHYSSSRGGGPHRRPSSSAVSSSETQSTTYSNSNSTTTTSSDQQHQLRPTLSLDDIITPGFNLRRTDVVDEGWVEVIDAQEEEELTAHLKVKIFDRSQKSVEAAIIPLGSYCLLVLPIETHRTSLTQ